MRAFGHPSLSKADALAAYAAYRAAGRLRQGFYEDNRGCGCAIGISSKIVNRANATMFASNDHAAVAGLLGVPVDIAYIMEIVFERLSTADATNWPSRLLGAIPEGADLSAVPAALMAWIRTHAQQNGQSAWETLEEHGYGPAGFASTFITRMALLAVNGEQTQRTERTVPVTRDGMVFADIGYLMGTGPAHDKHRNAAGMLLADKLCELVAAAPQGEDSVAKMAATARRAVSLVPAMDASRIARTAEEMQAREASLHLLWGGDSILIGSLYTMSENDMEELNSLHAAMRAALPSGIFAWANPIRFSGTPMPEPVVPVPGTVPNPGTIPTPMPEPGTGEPLVPTEPGAPAYPVVEPTPLVEPGNPPLVEPTPEVVPETLHRALAWDWRNAYAASREVEHA
ncbi:MAG: hypothetical protein ACRYHQ_24430 [Janthinobacterium lividum]